MSRAIKFLEAVNVIFRALVSHKDVHQACGCGQLITFHAHPRHGSLDDTGHSDVELVSGGSE